MGGFLRKPKVKNVYKTPKVKNVYKLFCKKFSLKNIYKLFLYIYVCSGACERQLEVEAVDLDSR